jgi:xanthine dehydrogenase accessory factor
MTTQDVQERALRLRADRVPFVHARVVLAERPTSAKPGDQAIVLADGSIEGFVGGQCAQATLRAQGLAALQQGSAFLLRIAPSPEPDQPGKTVVHNPCLSGGTLEIFMEPILPAPLVGILGDSPTAQALATVGAALGYAVEPFTSVDLKVVDAVVLASHGIDEDAALVAAVQSDVPYVGLIASPKRGAGVLAALDLTDEQRQRVRTPAGIDIGARTPEEVALSVFAEIIATRTAHSLVHEVHVAAETQAPLTAIDPVCQMTVAAVPTSIHADVDGTRFYFCCSGCRDRFVADPSEFAGT